MKTLLFTLSLFATTFVFPGEAFPVSALPSLWVAGERPTNWAKGELYIIECWASWCGPCMQVIPHIEQLWQTLKGEQVHVIGVNVVERHTPEAIRALLAKQTTPPTYALVADHGNNLKRYLKFTGIPFAVVVRDGEVIWRGHPARLTVRLLRSLKNPIPTTVPQSPAKFK